MDLLKRVWGTGPSKEEEKRIDKDDGRQPSEELPEQPSNGGSLADEALKEIAALVEEVESLRKDWAEMKHDIDWVMKELVRIQWNLNLKDTKNE